MVVVHGEVAPEIVLRDARLNVVGRIEVKPSVEDMGGRVGGVAVRDEGVQGRAVRGSVFVLRAWQTLGIFWRVGKTAPPHVL